MEKTNFWKYFFVCYLSIFIDQYWDMIFVYFPDNAKNVLDFMLQNQKLCIIIMTIYPFLISYFIISVIFKIFGNKLNLSIITLLIFAIGVYISYKLRINTGLQKFIFSLFPFPDPYNEVIMKYADNNSWELIYFMFSSATFLSSLLPVLVSSIAVIYILKKYNRFLKKIIDLYYKIVKSGV